MLTSRPFALIVFAAAWISFQPTHARGQEVEVVTQDSTVSTVTTGGGPSLLSPLPLHLSLKIDEGYDDNVGTRTAGGGGSLFTDGTVTFSYDRNDVRTKVNLICVAGGTYYLLNVPNPYDVKATLALFLSHNITARLTLAANIYGGYQTQPDFSANVGLNNRAGNYLNTVDKFTATYHWTSRFATVPTFTFQRVQYGSSSVGASQNRSHYTFGEQFRFHLSPRTQLVPEYRYEIVKYDSLAARDSTTHYLLFGVDEDFSSRLKFVVRGGATFRSFNGDGSRTDPNFEGSLDYALAPRSSLSWQTNYGVEEPNSSNSLTSVPLSRTTLRTGLQLRYALSARITANVTGYYHHDENQGTTSLATVHPGFSQDSYDLSLILRYAINRRFAFDLGFQRSQVISGQSSGSLGQSGQPFLRDRYSAGLSFTY
jgi:putative beta-barrel porin BBP2